MVNIWVLTDNDNEGEKVIVVTANKEKKSSVHEALHNNHYFLMSFSSLELKPLVIFNFHLI